MAEQPQERLPEAHSDLPAGHPLTAQRIRDEASSPIVNAIIAICLYLQGKCRPLGGWDC